MASTIKVDTIDTPDGTGNITVSRPLSGSGASLTSLPAANLTGTLPAIDGSNLTGMSSGGWGFVSQVVASGASTVAFTNMASGYDYMYITGPMIGTTDDTDFWFHLGVAGPTYRSSGYLSGCGDIASSDTSSGTTNTTEGMVNIGNGAVGNATDEGISFMETILLDSRFIN